MFLDYCESAGCPAVLDRPTVNAFVARLLDSGAEAATAPRLTRLVRVSGTLVQFEHALTGDVRV